jgi:SET domain-containing protein
MQVPYEVRFISGQKGHGVFALEDIRQGRVIYRLQSDRRATVVGDDLLQAYVERFYQTEEELARFLTYSFCASDKTCVDATASDCRFVNHSAARPNSALVYGSGDSVSIRDIRAGEEIVEDYGEYPSSPGYDILLGKHPSLVSALWDYTQSPD